jgi:hypothetical protein
VAIYHHCLLYLDQLRASLEVPKLTFADALKYYNCEAIVPILCHKFISGEDNYFRDYYTIRNLPRGKIYACKPDEETFREHMENPVYNCPEIKYPWKLKNRDKKRI